MHQLNNNFGAHDPNVSKYFGDKESSIHFDMTRGGGGDMDDDRSSTSSMKSKAFHGGAK